MVYRACARVCSYIVFWFATICVICTRLRGVIWMVLIIYVCQPTDLRDLGQADHDLTEV